jgi:hypothetical protein
MQHPHHLLHHQKQTPENPRLERWRPGELDYRLHRLVTEIRDGRHELREHFDPHLLLAQQELVGHPGRASERRRAAIEAAMIRQALAAPTPASASRNMGQALPPLGGSDYEGEMAWFLKVAAAFATRRPVRDLQPTARTADSHPQVTKGIS